MSVTSVRDYLDGVLEGGTLRTLVQLLTVGILLLLIGIPLGFFIWASVWSTAPGLGGQFTLDGYRQIFSQGIYEAALNTAIVAGIGTPLAMLFGLASVLFAVKADIPGKKLVSLVVILQYLFPGYIQALAWSVYQSSINKALLLLPFIDSPVVNVHTTFGIALVGAIHYSGLVYLLVSGAVKTVPRSLEEMAKISGASDFQITRDMIFKLSLPSILIAGVLVFTRLVQVFDIPLVLGLQNRVYVLSTYIYLALTQFPKNFKLGAALGMFILIASLLGLFVQRTTAGAKEKYQTTSDQIRMFPRESVLFKSAMAAYIVFLLIFYVMPLVILVIGSLQQNLVNLSMSEFTLENYQKVFRPGSLFWEAVKNSLFVAGFGAFIGMILSTVASYQIIKTDSSLSVFTDYLTLIPAAIPGIVFATAYLWIFVTYNPFNLLGTLWLVIIGLVGNFIIYGARATNSALRSVEDILEEAAQVSGANYLQILRDIYIPLIRSGFVAGYFILFIDFLKVLTIPLFLGGGDKPVLATLIWARLARASPEVAATITVIMMVMITVLYATLFVFTDIDVTSI